MRAEQVKWQEIEGEGILVNLETGYYFSLNPVGLFIWSHCDGQQTCRQIAAGLVEHFDVDEVTAYRDVESFLAQMDAEGLLRVLPPRTPAER
jgi:hypothetical protein